MNFGKSEEGEFFIFRALPPCFLLPRSTMTEKDPLASTFPRKHNMSFSDLPFEVLQKRLVPFLDTVSFVRLGRTCRANCHAVRTCDDTVWQAHHENRWQHSVTAPAVGDFRADFLRRAAIDADVRKKINGGTESAESRTEAIVLGYGLDAVDGLKRIELATPSRFCESVLNTMRMVMAVGAWQKLIREHRQSPQSIERGAAIVALLACWDLEGLVNMKSVPILEREIGKKLDVYAAHLSARLRREFPDRQPRLREILAAMQYYFAEHNSDERPRGERFHRFFRAAERDDDHDEFNYSIEIAMMTGQCVPLLLCVIYTAILRRATGIAMKIVSFTGYKILGVDGEDGTRVFVEVCHGGNFSTPESLALPLYHESMNPYEDHERWWRALVHFFLENTAPSPEMRLLLKLFLENENAQFGDEQVVIVTRMASNNE